MVSDVSLFDRFPTMSPLLQRSDRAAAQSETKIAPNAKMDHVALQFYSMSYWGSKIQKRTHDAMTFHGHALLGVV